MIYLDTSALVKLLVAENESSALVSWLTDNGQSLVCSDLARVELMRAVLRLDETGLLDEARSLLDGLDTLPITEAVIARAETIGPSTLRSLDAIHLAAAGQLGSELATFVSYDNRLREAAADIDMRTAAPGITQT